MGRGDERRASAGLEIFSVFFSVGAFASGSWDAQIVDGGSWRAPLKDRALVGS